MLCEGENLRFLLLSSVLMRECEKIACLLSKRVLRVVGHKKDNHMYIEKSSETEATGLRSFSI